MYFPEWVEKGCRTKKERATARLKFILSDAAFGLTGKTGLRGLEKIVGVDYTTMHLYIRNGAFSETIAERIVTALKARDSGSPIAADMLIKPLEIVAELT
jgi:hypothetical protein